MLVACAGCAVNACSFCCAGSGGFADDPVPATTYQHDPRDPKWIAERRRQGDNLDNQEALFAFVFKCHVCFPINIARVLPDQHSLYVAPLHPTANSCNSRGHLKYE